MPRRLPAPPDQQSAMVGALTDASDVLRNARYAASGMQRPQTLNDAMSNVPLFSPPNTAITRALSGIFSPEMMPVSGDPVGGISLSDMIPQNKWQAAIMAAGVLPGGKMLKGAKKALSSIAAEAEQALQTKPIRAYHGTKADFEAFDPSMTKDLGMHFGTAEQAEKAVWNPWSKEYPAGANIRPVDLHIQNPVRLPDMFSLLGKGMQAVAKKLTLETPLLFSDEAREALYGAAKRADVLKRKAGGIRQWLPPEDSTLLSAAEKAEYADATKRFWKTVEKTIKENGYDSAVYANKVEGKGDSYIVFDPNLIREAR